MGKKSLPIATVSFLSAAAHAGIVAIRGYRRGVSNTFSRSTRPTVLSGTTIGGTNMARKRIVVVDLQHRACGEDPPRLGMLPAKPWTNRDRRVAGRGLLRRGV